LFAIRAAGLLHGLQPGDAAACLSGLLIGGEIASARRRYRHTSAPVVLIVSGSLGKLYAVALGLAGIRVTEIDADLAVRSGLFEAARQNGMVASKGATA
jgi:2-dehydro-3-deoxygalactonokinase